MSAVGQLSKQHRARSRNQLVAGSVLVDVVPAPPAFVSRQYDWIKSLWVYVVRQAVHDYVKWKKSRNVERRRVAMDAYKWLFEPSKLPNSLENVCAIIGTSVEEVRNRAQAMTPSDVKKYEFMERERLYEPPPAQNAEEEDGD